MINKDKSYHFIAGFVIVAVVGMISTPLLGFAIGLIAAAGKEIWDKYKSGTVDGLDYIATVVGCLTAMELIR